MIWRAPEFWNHKSGREAAPVLRTLLTPPGWLYGHMTAKRIRTTTPYDPGIPVICVGNAGFGGTGKTPVTAYLLESLTRMGLHAVALTRGYGGQEKGPVIAAGYSVDQVGDEALLLSKRGIVWVAAGRDDGAKAARARGAQIIVMDDGHQNPLVRKTLSLLVVDAETGFGNERIFPAGPLREPVEAALARTDAVILMQPAAVFKTDPELLARLKGVPVIVARLAPEQALPDGKLFAFAGIGRPDKFFDALRRAGGDVVEGLSFSDHHKYSPGDMKNLFELAAEYGARLITTEKDHVRISTGYRRKITAWPVAVRFEDERALRRLLHPVIESARAAK